MQRIILFICLLCNLQSFAQDSSRTLAVVIGVSAYENNTVTPLQFANKDAYIFADYLHSEAGGSVAEENVRLLLDEEATNAAVYEAIDWLRATAKKGDLVYFYFSGHGDLENVTMYKNGYLICYNSPPNNYVRMAFSIDYLNDIANTLSVETQAKVVLITDACHAGKVAGENKRGNFLVGEQLLAIKDKEVRIASCEVQQLSNENEQWGGGRGVFSYYLVNGLQGEADLQNDGVITVGDIQTYLTAKLSQDPILKLENVKQTPVVKGEKNFALAKVPISNRTVSPVVNPADMGSGITVPETMSEEEKEITNLTPTEFFMKRAAAIGIKESFERVTEADRDREHFALALLRITKDREITSVGADKLLTLEKELQAEDYLLDRINNKIAVLIDNEGQRILNLYLEGDEAELEKRRYYNIFQANYDSYPALYSFAMKLTPPESFLFKILEVKYHYFMAIVARLSIPKSDAPDALVEKALYHIKKALEMEAYAAYLFNERGILQQLKGKYKEAEADYKKASALSPEWALPLANLGGLLASQKKYDAALVNINRADSLQPGFLGAYINKGYVYEEQKNFWLAEENYRKAILKNSRHFISFERLGHTYTKTRNYAVADSFFYEAEKRKAGYSFRNVEVLQVAASIVMDDFNVLPCDLDSNKIGKNDILAHFSFAMHYFKTNPELSLRWLLKTISIDEKSPLAYHYAAIIYRENKAYENADLFFTKAKLYYKKSKDLEQYAEMLFHSSKETMRFPCTEYAFSSYSYLEPEDGFYLADVAEKMHYYAKAEQIYTDNIKNDPSQIDSYKLLETLYLQQERYTEIEQLWNEYKARRSDQAYREQYAFYTKMVEKFPAVASWSYKLGLLLYDKASNNAADKYLDTIVFFPKAGKEAFIDLYMRNEVISNPTSLYAIDAAELGMKREMFAVGENDVREIVTIPGTKVTFILQPIVYTPRIEAVKYLQKADSLTTDFTARGEILNKIANVYLWSGSPTYAQRYYKSAAVFLPEDASVASKYINTSRAIYHNTEAMAALTQLQKTARLDFDNRVLLSEAYLLQGKYLEAQKELDTASQVYHIPNDKLLQLQANSFMQQERYADAIALYKKLVDVKKEGSSSMYNIATAYAMQNNTAQAMRFLSIAIKEGFNYKYVLENDKVWDKIKTANRWKNLVANMLAKHYDY